LFFNDNNEFSDNFIVNIRGKIDIFNCTLNNQDSNRAFINSIQILNGGYINISFCTVANITSISENGAFYSAG
jgi:hypothetical protein